MKKIILAGLWILMGCFPGVAGAIEATMSAPAVDFQSRELLVSSKLDVNFNSRLKEALDSGMQISFFFTMELYRVRSWWWDENVATVPIAYSVKYDNLKKEYLIGAGEEGPQRVVRDYREMKAAVLQLHSITLGLPEDMEGSSADKFYIQIMGEMPSFEPNFLFFSSSEFSTPWVESQEFSIPFLPPPTAEDSVDAEEISPERQKEEVSIQ